jgi:hypothetical protein
MRLKRLEHSHRLPQRLLIGLIGLVSRERAPDVIRTLLYRPEFFGTPMNEVMEHAMRGPSPWSVGERELFAAFVSRQNQCAF